MNNCSCSKKIPDIYKGDSAKIALDIVLPDGSKMDFQGKTVKFIVKKNKQDSDSDALIYKEFNPSQSTEELLIFLSPQETDIAPALYWFGVRVIDGEEQTTEGEGLFPVVQGVYHGM